MRAVTIAFKPDSFEEPEKYLQETLNKAEAEIEQAMLLKPDLICLPETFASMGDYPDKWILSKQPLDGSIITKMSSLARKHGVYITCPMLLEDQNRIFNTILLLDRNGQTAARYDKFIPTIGEMELDVVPGSGAVIAETEIGKIGFVICFDLNFEELRQQYKKLSPDLIIFCSMFHGGLMQQWWAYDCQVYFAASVPGPHSAILNPLGEIISETSNYRNIAHADLNFESRVIHLDYNMEKFDDIRRKYESRVQIRIPFHLGTALIQNCDKNLPIDDVIKEFDLEPVDQYFDRSRRKKNEVTEK